MKHKPNILVTYTILVFAFLAACQNNEVAPVVTSEAEIKLSPDQILTVGTISDDPAAAIRATSKLAYYLADTLAEEGVEKGEVVVAPDIETMKKYLQNGTVDIYIDSANNASLIYRDAGAVPLLRQWMGGVDQIYTYIIARRDKEIDSVGDLVGQMVAVDDPESTSGYVLPKAHLIQIGYELNEKDSPAAGVESYEIGYVFSGSEENTVAWLLLGNVPISAISNITYDKMPQFQKDQLVIVTQSIPVPRSIVLARSDLPKTLQDRIVEILLGMDKTDDGRDALEIFEGTTKFDRFPGDIKETMDDINDLFRYAR